MELGVCKSSTQECHAWVVQHTSLSQYSVSLGDENREGSFGTVTPGRKLVERGSVVWSSFGQRLVGSFATEIFEG